MRHRSTYIALLIVASAVAVGVGQGTTPDSMVDVGGYRLNVTKARFAST